METKYEPGSFLIELISARVSLIRPGNDSNRNIENISIDNVLFCPLFGEHARASGEVKPRAKKCTGHVENICNVYALVINKNI